MGSRRTFVSVVLAACLGIVFFACGQSEGGAVESGGPAPEPPGRIDAQVFGAFHKASKAGF